MLTLADRIHSARTKLTNFLVSKQEVPSWVLIELSGSISEFPQANPLARIPFAGRLPLGLSRNPQSISELRRIFVQLSADDRIQGVVLQIRCIASPSHFQSMRTIIANFRNAGKRVVAYANNFGPFGYYLACACDKIVMPPAAEWTVLGLGNEYVFLKDALETVGISAEVVNVSPFKSAGDQFSRNDFSDQSRAQAEWLLDAQYSELIRGISLARGLEENSVRALIDKAPYGASQAVANGLIDETKYEDELGTWLAPQEHKTPDGDQRPLRLFRRSVLPAALRQRKSADTNESSWIGRWSEVRRTLAVPVEYFAKPVLGVISIEGAITEGQSQTLPVPLPFVGSRTAGCDSVNQVIRVAERNPQIGAVVVYVNSPGGSALASDLIAREIDRLAHKKPVFVYMGGVAASGGYYVAAFGRKIVAQPLTITGSIGVILTKPNIAGLLEKGRLHVTTLNRGERSDAFGVNRAFSADERAAAVALIQRAYSEFKGVVAKGRKIDADKLEDICGGRVWTGAQALSHNLVDEVGDFTVVQKLAHDALGIHPEYTLRTMMVQGSRHSILPTAWPLAARMLSDPGSLFREIRRSIRTMMVLPFVQGEVD